MAIGIGYRIGIGIGQAKLDQKSAPGRARGTLHRERAGYNEFVEKVSVYKFLIPKGTGTSFETSPFL